MSRPDADVSTLDLAAIEARIRRAIDKRRPDLLTTIGNGELSIAIRWGSDASACVVKRVPPFPSRAAADQYCNLVREHLGDLASCGVRCVSTRLQTLDRPDGSAVVYHGQPLLDPPALADQVLRGGRPDAEHPVVIGVLDATVRTLRAGFPLDAQFANWCWFDDEPWQLDFSTPLMMDDKGEIRFDSTGFQREYPAVMRRLVYRELMKIAPRYADVVYVLTDVIAQLHRQNLEAWCQPVADAARQRHGIELSPTLAKERFEADAKFYPTLLRMKRFQRFWIQRTGRRYDTLLPATTSFGR